MTAQCTSREDRLFVLATILREKGLTPNSNLYKTVIVKVNGQTFHLPPARLDELTKILTSAYKADQWASILGEVAPQKQVIIDQSIIITNRGPIEHTPKQDALILRGMARRDTYDGVGRLILKEVQVEIHNITAEEIIQTWNTYNHKDSIEQEGNVFKIYWGGKDKLESKRSLRTPIIPGEAPQLFRQLEYVQEPKYSKGDFMGDKSNYGVGETVEEEGDYTEAE